MTWPKDAALRHGNARRGKRIAEYGVWAGMHQRCHNPASKSFPNYGGRGIFVCDRWEEFSAFFADMGQRPTPSHTLERVNNNAGYGPDNCTWATRSEQCRNRRPRRKADACKQGHFFADGNEYVRPDGKRGCRICRAESMRRFYERQKQGSANV